MSEKAQTMMMLDIDGVLTQHQATPTDVLTAAQALAVSAIGDLVNKAAVPAGSSQSSGAGGTPAGQQAAVPVGNVQCSSLRSGAGGTMFNVQSSDALHRFADLAADQIRAAMHARIDEGKRADW